jgi:hypothetical protein
MKTVTVTNKVVLNFFLNAALQSIASTMTVDMKWGDRLKLAGISGLMGVVNYMKSSPRKKKIGEVEKKEEVEKKDEISKAVGA